MWITTVTVTDDPFAHYFFTGESIDGFSPQMRLAYEESQTLVNEIKAIDDVTLSHIDQHGGIYVRVSRPQKWTIIGPRVRELIDRFAPLVPSPLDHAVREMLDSEIEAQFPYYQAPVIAA